MRTLGLASLLLVCGAWAGPTLDPASTAAFDSLNALHQFHDLALSPDGSLLAWTEAARTREPGEPLRSTIFVKEMRDGGAAPRRVVEPVESVNGLAWSRDGRLAYIASDSGSQVQLFIVEKPADKRSKPRRLTNATGYLGGPKWSSDGRSIAYLWIEGAGRTPGPTEATVADAGEVQERFDEQRLTVLNLDTRQVKQTPADMYVYEFDWSPDAAELAYLAAPGAGDGNWFIAELYAMRADSGAVRHILKPSMQAANVRWSPDGKQIAFIGGLMSDEGSTGGDIFSVAASGGEARDLTPGRKSSPNWFRWLPSSREILFTEGVSGSMAISTLDIPSGSSETLWKGQESVTFTGDATVSAVVRTTWNQPPELWAGATGKWNQVTHSNAAIHAGWGEVKTVNWTSDGDSVQGWLVLPVQYDASKKYPMVVLVHGGPAAEYRAAWPRQLLPMQLLSAKGYFIFLPNPRGSYGHGENFTRANVRDFGNGDLRDILAGTDTVVRDYPVDDKRVGIAGWSYGGYMTMWAVTQTNRFRAAFAGAGISNWQSYYGENSIDQWMIPYFGASVYDDPAVYAKSSPITYIKQVKTPTLIAVGDRDGECPPPQSYEFWHALKTFGVKTEFVLYPGEGHGFHKAEDMRDLWARVSKWFEENMPPAK